MQKTWIKYPHVTFVKDHASDNIYSREHVLSTRFGHNCPRWQPHARLEPPRPMARSCQCFQVLGSLLSWRPPGKSRRPRTFSNVPPPSARSRQCRIVVSVVGRCKRRRRPKANLAFEGRCAAAYWVRERLWRGVRVLVCRVPPHIDPTKVTECVPVSWVLYSC